MKKALSLIIALLLTVGCLCAAHAEEASGAGTLRKSPLWDGYYSFPIQREDYSELFWSVVQEENTYSRASLSEADWIEIGNLESVSFSLSRVSINLAL